MEMDMVIKATDCLEIAIVRKGLEVAFGPKVTIQSKPHPY